MRKFLAAAAVACAMTGCASTQMNMNTDIPEGRMVHYLEIVTPNVDEVCAAYEAANGLTFGEADATLGNARTAPLPNGAMIGVRGPLRPDETPVVRPYWLVEDLEAAVAKAADAGAEIALPRMELPGHGTIALYIHGGVEHGLWQR